MRKEDFETYAARGGSLGTVVFEGTREELTPSVFVRAQSIARDLRFLERHRTTCTSGWVDGWVREIQGGSVFVSRGGILVTPAAFLRVELGPDLLRQIYGGGDDFISGALIGILSVLSVLLRVLQPPKWTYKLPKSTYKLVKS